jgi:hypothetical protein
MKIRFLFGDGKSLERETSGDQTVSEIKTQIAQEITIDANIQKWVYGGRILLDHQTLISCDFRDGDAIHVIKGALKQPQQPAPGAATELALPQSAGTSGRQSVIIFDRAMGYFLTKNTEDNVKNCLLTLFKIISNIIDNPHEEKYRRLKNSNQHFQKKVGSQEGSSGLLQSLGFSLNGDEWVLTPTAETWETIVTCQQKLNKFLNKLKTLSTDPVASLSPSSSPSKRIILPSSSSLFPQ